MLSKNILTKGCASFLVPHRALVLPVPCLKFLTKFAVHPYPHDIIQPGMVFPQLELYLILCLAPSGPVRIHDTVGSLVSGSISSVFLFELLLIVALPTCFNGGCSSELVF